MNGARSAAGNRAVSFDIVTDGRQLEALAPPWRELWQRCPDATPFQSPEWLLPWWRHFPEDKSLLVVAGYQRDELVLMLPTCVMHGTAMFVGSANSDRLDVLTTDRALLPGAMAVLERCEWQTLDLQQLPMTSPVLDLPGDVTDDEPCPVVALPAPVSAHFAKRLESSRRQLESQGDVAFSDDPSPDGFATFCELHRRRWAARGQAGVLDEPSRAFLADVVRASPCARVGVLTAGGTPVAASLGLLRNDVFYFYLGGFDPALERIGVGNLMVYEAMHAAQAEGARRFDFLRGREGYKYRWGATDTPTRRWRRTRGAA